MKATSEPLPEPTPIGASALMPAIEWVRYEIDEDA